LLLASRHKPATLYETPPQWLPEYTVAEAKPIHLTSLIGIALALAKELSGEADMDRQAKTSVVCVCDQAKPGTVKQHAYLEMTRRRFNGIRRCC
jgi:hypothetical protein